MPVIHRMARGSQLATDGGHVFGFFTNQCKELVIS